MKAFRCLITTLWILTAAAAATADQSATPAAAAAAVKAAQNFRRSSWPAILADGWKFITSVNHPQVPDSGMDYFYQGVAPVTDELRSAWVLHAYYQKFNVDDPGLPPWQSEKWLVWINCSEHSWQARGTGKFDSLTGSGPQVHSSLFADSPWLPATAPVTLVTVVPGTLADLLVRAICAERISPPKSTGAPGS